MNPTSGKAKIETQVLVLGLPRCATTSLATALASDAINIQPVLHAADSGLNKERRDLIMELCLAGPRNAARRRANLGQIVNGYAACTETLNVFADDLVDLYPGAKLILNTRPDTDTNTLNAPTKTKADFDEPTAAAVAWAQSCNDAIAFFTSPWALAVCWMLGSYRFWWHRYRLQTDIWRRRGLIAHHVEAYEWRWWCRRLPLLAPKGAKWMVPEFYDRYNAWIQDEAAKRGRELLVWHPGMGWGPLCEFLGKEVPQQEGDEGTPLPHGNEIAKQQEQATRLI
ncbi:hypothetical protein BJX65DRAFT_313457 [Aspergillus insuetus]